ncbi:hypothetical protein TBLA_0D00940 [Henningerozyma blattae CBS 6284]|uniref:Uncharacterized protein n=1 Tax=Henningerozyma blattae (strain ATCC 34711 / CBS 6284 / DSM 70876 / NBRC 10599 / NRRL Y-10934 / UCD 77-7) TaxID=1071380 RepID=I2H2K0_HENB6|nr:hypothetical protein TBLA_0D00940 [Tetrapisispora blattae CBS 6284]CCH60602.1 hypothetical protein TBLA_0D00940 [Tetrapisispora blattae CBS 6284]
MPLKLFGRDRISVHYQDVVPAINNIASLSDNQSIDSSPIYNDLNRSDSSIWSEQNTPTNTHNNTTANALIMQKFSSIYEKIRHYYIYKISIIHWVLLTIWLSFLFKLTRIYYSLYNKTTLGASILTNIILFGISDILAQSISCYFSLQLDPSPSFINNTSHQFFRTLGIEELFDSDAQLTILNTNSLNNTVSNIENNDNDNYTIEADRISIFNDYALPNDNANEPMAHRPLLGPFTDTQSHPDLESGLPDITHNDSLLENDLVESRGNLFKADVFGFYRWICFMFWGFFITFFQVPWYKFLNFFFTEDPTIVKVFERVLSDQLLYSPVSLYYFFKYSNYIMEHGDHETFKLKIKKLYISTLGCNYMVWPMVQFLNFLIVPKHFQVPFSSSVGILWNCFLSMRNASSS